MHTFARVIMEGEMHVVGLLRIHYVHPCIHAVDRPVIRLCL